MVGGLVPLGLGFGRAGDLVGLGEFVRSDTGGFEDSGLGGGVGDCADPGLGGGVGELEGLGFGDVIGALDFLSCEPSSDT